MVKIDDLTLEQINSFETNECSCKECQNLCQSSRPCWGTPDEVRLLIERGYARRLMEDYYEGDLNHKEMPYVGIISPAIRGHEGDKAPWLPRGHCTFLMETGLCEIHSLKPIEGRASSCKEDNSGGVHFSLVHIWNTPEGKAVVNLWREEIGGNVW